MKARPIWRPSGLMTGTLWTNPQMMRSMNDFPRWSCRAVSVFLLSNEIVWPNIKS